MNHRIIALSGYSGSGKDALAHFLEPLGWKRFAFADQVREAALILNPTIVLTEPEPERESGQRVGAVTAKLSDLVSETGWDLAKRIPEVRATLQRLGTDIGRNLHGDDCWIKLLAKTLVPYLSRPDARAVITDVRFSNELLFLLDLGAVHVRVVRSGVDRPFDHSSERPELLVDPLIVSNSGSLEDFKALAINLDREIRINPIAIWPLGTGFSQVRF